MLPELLEDGLLRRFEVLARFLRVAWERAALGSCGRTFQRLEGGVLVQVLGASLRAPRMLMPFSVRRAMSVRVGTFHRPCLRCAP
jgi:hypothetical protein